MLPAVKPIIFEIPLTPPSVNHYKVPMTIRTSKGPRKTYVLTPEAKAFHHAVGIFARGESLTPATAKERNEIRYGLAVTVYLGANERGDGDNFWKCIADGLQRAGVIHSDARVGLWLMQVNDSQRDNPRTRICIFTYERGGVVAAVQEISAMWEGVDA